MKKKEIVYPVQFNIRPGDYKRHKRFFKVLIFESQKDMYAFYLEYARQSKWKPRPKSHMEKYGISKKATYDPSPQFQAIVMPYCFYGTDKYKVGDKRRNDIGVMLFYKDMLGVGLVAHEFGHAAFWHNRIKLNGRPLNLGEGNCILEEACLYDLASMVRKFTAKCYQLGIY